MDIKQHILSMAPSAQNMLLEAAVKEHNMAMLSQLMTIIGEQRDVNNLVANLMMADNKTK